MKGATRDPRALREHVPRRPSSPCSPIVRAACGSAAGRVQLTVLEAARNAISAQGRPRGRECHGDPWQGRGNMDRGRIRPAAVRSRPLSYHQGDRRRIAAGNRRNRRDGQWGSLAEWPGRNRPHPAGRDPQEPQGAPLIRSVWSASTDGRAPGPSVTAAACAHGNRRHGWAPLVRREQRCRVARSDSSFEPGPVASDIDPVGDR